MSKAALLNKKDLYLYLHWPFCLSKCPYCDFASIAITKDSDLFSLYGDLILEDLKKTLSDLEESKKISEDYQIKTIFFGGGTPSLMFVGALENILSFLHSNYTFADDIEITLEANPATFDILSMRVFKGTGINRISLGIQSFCEDNLRFLGRIYNSREAKITTEVAAKVFDNFSIDLMYGYETQNLDSLKYDLETAMQFNCKHLSCYQLTFEEGTSFYSELLKGNIKQFSEDESLKFYNFIGDFLQKHDINRYEVSNYARNGYECKHNLGYWNYREYIGIGPAAHGRIRMERVGEKKNSGTITEDSEIGHSIFSKNNSSLFATEKIKDPFKWAEAVKKGENAYSVFSELSHKDELQERIIMGLRMINGMNLAKIRQFIPQNLLEKAFSAKKLNFLRDNELIEENTDDFLRLTKSGMTKMNSVVEFLCEDL